MKAALSLSTHQVELLFGRRNSEKRWCDYAIVRFAPEKIPGESGCRVGAQWRNNQTGKARLEDNDLKNGKGVRWLATEEWSGANEAGNTR